MGPIAGGGKPRVALENALAGPVYEGVPIWIQHWGFCQVFVTKAAHLLKAAPQICKAASFSVFAPLGNIQRNKEIKSRFILGRGKKVYLP